MDRPKHGLINYKETKTKCRLYWYLIEFIDWRYYQSCFWYFRPNFLIHSPPSPAPSQSPNTVYKKSTYVAGEGVKLCWRPYSAGFLTLCI
jgi:hypothetical protein